MSNKHFSDSTGLKNTRLEVQTVNICNRLLISALAAVVTTDFCCLPPQLNITNVKLVVLQIEERNALTQLLDLFPYHNSCVLAFPYKPQTVSVWVFLFGIAPTAVVLLELKIPLKTVFKKKKKSP